jgi:hypothetical protein
MQRVLNLFQISAFGISAIIGGGIFVVTGLQAKNNAGCVPRSCSHTVYRTPVAETRLSNASPFCRHVKACVAL